MKHVEFRISAVRGLQGGQAFYTAMCPIRFLPRLFPDDSHNATGQSQQSFRLANPIRAREIARDIIEHHDDYHVAAVTISIESRVRFVGQEKGDSRSPCIGDLIVPLDARLIIIDGVHRIDGLKRALTDCPSLADDSIVMVIHVDPTGQRRGQIFSDVKRHERTTAKSLRIGLDDRDEMARLTRAVISEVPIFNDAIELEKTTISNRSRKLFTLSALYQANRELLGDHKQTSYEHRLELAVQFWAEVARLIPEWNLIVNSDTSAAEIRAGYVHCHAIGIAAIARAGRALLAHSPKSWKRRLGKLSSLNWSRGNKQLWEGRAMIGGRLSKSSSAVARAGIAVKQHLGLRLTPEEQAMDR